jgi:hypothetical protein
VERVERVEEGEGGGRRGWRKERVEEGGGGGRYLALYLEEGT